MSSRKLSKRRLVIALGTLTLGVAAYGFLDSFVEQRYLWMLDSADPEVQERAALKLREMRSTRGSQKLLRMFFEDAGRPHPDGLPFSGRALVELGRPVLDPLVKLTGQALTSNRVTNFGRIFKTFGAEAVRRLVEHARGNGDLALKNALMILAEMGSKADTALPFLIENLSSEDPNIRWLSAHSIGDIGVRSETADRALFDLIRREGELEHVRTVAADTLVEIIQTEELVPEFVALLEPRCKELAYDTIERTAYRCLEKLGPGAAAAVPQLITCLRSNYRAEVSDTLRSIGAEGVPALREILEHEDEPLQTRKRAARALREQSPQGRVAIDGLVKLMFDELAVAEKHSVALSTLGTLGAPAREALEQALETEMSQKAIEEIRSAIQRIDTRSGRDERRRGDLSQPPTFRVQRS